MAGRLQALFLALVAVAVFLVGDAHPALAAATAPAVPAEPLPPAPAGSTALYDRYPLEAFTVDEGDYGSAVAARGAHNTINLLMVSRAWLVKLSARVAEQALTFRPAAALAGAARELTAEVSGLVWPQDSLPAPLVVGALATAGLWGLFLLLRGRSGAAWRTLISTSLVLVVAGATLAGLDRMLSTLDEFTHELSRLSFIAATRPLGTSPAITAPVQA
ncbi:MAG TPA: hypothetical protein VD902_14805, partial [Symbiobacteriaceae bacterium]|nr:hypothetical protein [Symbiobacteriaceae bacterium]